MAAMFRIFEQRLVRLRLLLLLLVVPRAECTAPITTNNQYVPYTISNNNNNNNNINNNINNQYVPYIISNNNNNADTRNSIATTISTSIKPFSNSYTDNNNNLLCVSSYFLSLQPVPSSCRHYVLCYRDQVLRQLPCPDGTAFSATTFVCLQELYLPCIAKEVQKLVKTTLSCSSDLLTFYPDYSQGCPSNSFYRCQRRQLTKHECPQGTAFDEGTDACLTSSQSISCVTSGPLCPDNLRDVAIYADYSHGCPAAAFTLCSPGGGEVTVSCPKGLYYNGAIKNCDYPQEIVCANNVPFVTL